MEPYNSPRMWISEFTGIVTDVASFLSYPLEDIDLIITFHHILNGMTNGEAIA